MVHLACRRVYGAFIDAQFLGDVVAERRRLAIEGTQDAKNGGRTGLRFYPPIPTPNGEFVARPIQPRNNCIVTIR